MKSSTRWLLISWLLFVSGGFAMGWLLGRWPADAEPMVEATGVPAAEEAVDTYDEVALEAREGRLVAEALAGENALLRKRIETLQQEAEQLTVAVAIARMEADQAKVERSRAQVDAVAVAGAAETIQSSGLVLLDVDVERGVVALNGGAGQGLREGMRFHALREDKRVATVRVVEVREGLAGAVVEEQGPEGPEAGDRLILVRTPKR